MTEFEFSFEHDLSFEEAVEATFELLDYFEENDAFFDIEWDEEEELAFLADDEIEVEIVPDDGEVQVFVTVLERGLNLKQLRRDLEEEIMPFYLDDDDEDDYEEPRRRRPLRRAVRRHEEDDYEEEAPRRRRSREERPKRRSESKKRSGAKWERGSRKNTEETEEPEEPKETTREETQQEQLPEKKEETTPEKSEKKGFPWVTTLIILIILGALAYYFIILNPL